MQIKTFHLRSRLLSSLFFLFAAQLFGQNTNKKSSTPQPKNNKTNNAITFFMDFKTFKYHTETSFGSDSFRRLNVNDVKTKGFYPALAYTHHKANGHFTETALTFIQFQNEDDLSTTTFPNLGNSIQVPDRGAKSLNMKTALRFGYNVPLIVSETNIFYLGISTEPILSYSNVMPYTSASFPDTRFEINNIIALTPRFIKNMGKKLFFDVNIPVSLFSMKFIYENFKNPILPIQQQRKSVFETAFVPRNLQFRMGIGVRI